MMADHSPEPWSSEGWLHDETSPRPKRTKKILVHGLFDAAGGLIADAAIGRDYCEMSEPIAPADLRRIVACVNACKGIPTEWLEKYGRRAVVRQIIFVDEKRAELLHEILSRPLEGSEKIVALEKCEHCGGVVTRTEADDKVSAKNP